MTHDGLPEGYKPTNTVGVVAGAGRKYEQTRPTTHDKLLATTEKSELGWYYDWMKDALRAVVELHGQVGVVCGWCTCRDCDHIVDYPCKTIRVIEGAFNADL